RTALLPLDDQADDALPFTKRRRDPCSRVGRHIGGCGGGGEQYMIEMVAALPAARRRQPGGRRETPLGDESARVVANAAEGRAADRLGEAVALEHAHARRHQSLAAGLLLREAPALEQLDRQP